MQCFEVKIQIPCEELRPRLVQKVGRCFSVQKLIVSFFQLEHPFVNPIQDLRGMLGRHPRFLLIRKTWRPKRLWNLTLRCCASTTSRRRLHTSGTVGWASSVKEGMAYLELHKLRLQKKLEIDILRLINFCWCKSSWPSLQYQFHQRQTWCQGPSPFLPPPNHTSSARCSFWHSLD